MAPGLGGSGNRTVTALPPQCGPVGPQGARPPGACLVTLLCAESQLSQSTRGRKAGLAAWLAVRGLEERGREWAQVGRPLALVNTQQKAPAPQGAPNDQAAK